MTKRYCKGERFADLSFAGEVFESCDFADCVFVDCSFSKCELDHTTLNECRFVRCEITGLRSVDLGRLPGKSASRLAERYLTTE